jgi:hypothetical protein
VDLQSSEFLPLLGHRSSNTPPFVSVHLAKLRPVYHFSGAGPALILHAWLMEGLQLAR